MDFFSCRAILDPAPASGAWNMAVDEALLESALERGTCAVRLYRWEEATLSLGYFQKPGDVADDPRWSGLPRVRRLSGGGAILHHHEWTYSCVLAPDHPRVTAPHLLYGVVHEAILAVLAERGVTAALRGDPAIASVERIGDPSSAPPAEAFLCFARGDARDIVCGGNKIVGSAQRRRRGAVLQHGSILLDRSEFAPEFPGVVDLVPEARIDAGLGIVLLERIAKALLSPAEERESKSADRSGGIARGELDERERRRAIELAAAIEIDPTGRTQALSDSPA